MNLTPRLLVQRTAGEKRDLDRGEFNLNTAGATARGEVAWDEELVVTLKSSAS